MRRYVVTVAIAAAVLSHGPAFARVSTHSRSTPRTTVPATPPTAIAISAPGTPPGAPISAALHPGSSTSLHITVANLSTSDRLDVQLTTTDAAVGAGGAVVASPTGAQPGDGASSWLGLSDTVLALEPSATVDVPITVSVPPEATGGSVAALIKAAITQATPIGNPVSARDLALVGQSATVGVRVDVQAPKRAELNVTSVTVAREHDARVVRVTVANVGSSPAPITGTLTLGTPAVTTRISTNVPAHGDATVRVPWPKSLPTNKPADATVSVRHGDDNADWSGQIDPRADQPVHHAKPAASTTGPSSPGGGGGLGVPWWVVLAIGCAAVWLAYELYAANRVRNHGPVRAPVPSGAGVDASSVRLHDELEPLVAAITSLAERLAPGPARGGAHPPTALAEPEPPEHAPTEHGLPEPAPPEHALLESIDPPDATRPAPADPEWLDEVRAPRPTVIDATTDCDHEHDTEPATRAPYDIDIDEHIDEDAHGGVDRAFEAAPGPQHEHAAVGAHATANAVEALRPWEPHLELHGIFDVLHRIAPPPEPTLDEASGAAVVLTPEELVDAVASALTVAPATVRHWLSDETLDAATRSVVAPNDTIELVRERQILAAQVEVLKRALSDLA